MDELLAAIAKLVGHSNQDEVITLLETKAPTLRHKIFQKGHDVGYGQKADELRKAQEKITGLEGDVTKLKGDLTTAQQQNPDVAKIQADAAGKIKEIDDRSKAREAELLGTISTTVLSRTRSDTLAALVSGGVDPDYAAVLVDRPDIAARRKVDPTTGKLQILQEGGTIPYAPAPAGKTDVDSLVTELLAKVPPKFLTSHVDVGSGDRNGGAPAKGIATVVAEIRSQAEKDRKDAKAAAPGVDGLPPALVGLAVPSR